MKYFALLLLLLMITSCSLTPFAPSTSGRSYGAGRLQTEVGNTNSNYHLKLGFGASDKLDLGFDMEFGAISTSAIFLKYAIVNNKTGPALGVEFGYGSTESTKFYYGGVVGSIVFGKQFEVFTNLRLNSVSTDESDIEKDEFNGNIKILAYDVNYLQATYGFNLYFSDSAGLSLYSTYFKGQDIETLEDNTFGASLIFNM